MKKVKIKSIELAPIVGFGYWKDVYFENPHGIEGITHNFIIPFVRMQFGYLKAKEK